MSSTASSSVASASAAAGLLGHRPRRNTSHFFLGISSSPNHAQNSKPKSPPPKPIAAIASHTLRRRESSIALASLCLSLVFDASVAAGAPSETPECPLTFAPSGLAFCDKVVGSGTEATKGQLIKAHYEGRLENGKVFDSSYGRGKPLTFRVGVGEVIKGWDQGILGGEGIPPMLAGGQRTLKLPPELGYGARGAGCSGGTCIIPPNSTLLFDVEFIGKA